MSRRKLSTDPGQTFYYCFDEAVEIILTNVPPVIRTTYSWDDITLILELKDEYIEDFCEPFETGICEFPIEIDEKKMRREIIRQANANGLKVKDDDLIEILDAELIYFEKNGALRDAGEWLN
ncbi:MAG: hypothetical protein ACO29O_04065 [Chitinophagaceae bacterium]